MHKCVNKGKIDRIRHMYFYSEFLKMYSYRFISIIIFYIKSNKLLKI